MAHLISASRRTDIPRFYARWFTERRRAGWAEFRNAFGGGGRVSLLNLYGSIPRSLLRSLVTQYPAACCGVVY